MLEAIIGWWIWLKETIRALFLPPQPDAVVTWIGESALTHRDQ